MQDAVDNQSTLNEIALKLREELEPIFIESFSEPNSQFENLEGIQELVSWYKKTRKKDNILEKVLEDIINETMKYLPQQYASLCVENIKINSKEKKQKVKFNINFQLEPIKSYVEFAIIVNKIRKKTRLQRSSRVASRRRRACLLPSPGRPARSGSRAAWPPPPTTRCRRPRGRRARRGPVGRRTGQRASWSAPCPGRR